MVDTEFRLQGEKVILERFTLADVNDTYIGWLNDRDVLRFSNQRFMTHDRQSCLRYLASFDGTSNLFIMIRRLSNRAPIGTMTAYVCANHGTVDVGIMIGDKSVWGMGFGQDAWNTLTNWLLEREDIRKITAGTLACNYGMRKLLDRSGMQHEATRKDQEIVNDEIVDIFYYAKFHEA